MAGTELMPRLVGGDTELGGGKLKRGNRFWKPNLGMGPNGTSCSAHQDSLTYLDAESRGTSLS